MLNRIKHWREQRGMSMEELALAAGTTAPTINKLEKGYMRLTQEWMMRLAQPLNVDPDCSSRR